MTRPDLGPIADLAQVFQALALVLSGRADEALPWVERCLKAAEVLKAPTTAVAAAALRAEIVGDTTGLPPPPSGAARRTRRPCSPGLCRSRRRRGPGGTAAGHRQLGHARPDDEDLSDERAIDRPPADRSDRRWGRSPGAASTFVQSPPAAADRRMASRTVIMATPSAKVAGDGSGTDDSENEIAEGRCQPGIGPVFDAEGGHLFIGRRHRSGGESGSGHGGQGGRDRQGPDAGGRCHLDRWPPPLRSRRWRPNR